MSIINKAEVKKQRNYGIDLLRIVSMLLIPILHILGHGGLLNAVQIGTVNYKIIWFMEIAAYCGVNCYALISGYVGYSSKYKYANIIMLYLQVVFYSATIFFFFYIFKPEILAKQDFISMLLPVSAKQYWFFTAYFCLSLFIPFLNMVLDNLDRVTGEKLFITIIILFTVLPTIFHYDIFYIGDGYSAMWLALLYLIGGCINKFDIGKHGKTMKYLLGYFICITVTWIFKIWKIQVFTEGLFAISSEGEFFVSYTSPTILFAGIMLLIGFRNLNLKDTTKKIIGFFAPLTFGVYLVHENPIIRRWIIVEKFRGYADYNPFVLVGVVLGTSISIWFICSLIDKIRLCLFKVMRVHIACSYIERLLAYIGKKIRLRKE